MSAVAGAIDTFKSLQIYFKALEDGYINIELFTKRLDELNIELFRDNSNTLDSLILPIIPKYINKDNVVNIITLISVIEYSVQIENYELAQECKDAIKEDCELKSEDYDKLFDFFNNNNKVDY